MCVCVCVCACVCVIDGDTTMVYFNIEGNVINFFYHIETGCLFQNFVHICKK